MYKLLLVDDFFVERENVKDIINDFNIELEINGEVENGKEALEVIEKDCPDFILTDIEMPIMNGIELAEIVHNQYPKIKIIFFTFYNKFEYAQRAISFDVHAYILKPIVPEEMKASLEKIIQEKKAEERLQDKQQELKKLVSESMPLLINKFKLDLFMGRYKQESDIYNRLKYLNIQSEHYLSYLVVVVELDDYANIISTKSLEEIDMLGIMVSKIVEHNAKEGSNTISVRVDDNHWAVIINGQQSKVDIDKINDKANDFSEKLLSDLSKHNISASIGLSSPFHGLTCSSTKYKEGLYALEFKYSLGNGQIIRINDIQSESEYAGISISDIEKSLKNLIYTGDDAGVDPYIRQLLSLEQCKLVSPNKNSLKNTCYSILTCTQVILSDLNVSYEDIFGKGELIWDKLVRFETIVDTKQWLINILTEIIRYINTRNNNQLSNVVETVKKICQEKYKTSITIKAIANEMFYNPNYLNNMFKKETGETILEYITKLRIEKAKQLLRQPEIKIYEIAQEIGYSHESYFRNIFKQHVGIGPKEYKEFL